MKRIPVQIFILMVVMFCNTVDLAIGEDNKKSDCLEKSCIDTKCFTKEQVEGSALVKKFCTSCHSEDRVFSSLKEIRRDSSLDYEKNVRSIVIKKLRITSGQMSRQDSKKIIGYLVTL